MKKKVLLFSLIMAAMMALPMTASAQGLFGSKETPTVWEDEGDSRQSETPRVPLGSGLLILAAAGAGYAVIKKKEK